jgi:hypothetical protein
MMAPIGQVHGELAAGRDRGRTSLQGRRLGNERKVADELAPAPEIACKGDALQLRMRGTEASRSIVEQKSGTVDVAVTLARPAPGDGLEDTGLEGRTEALFVLDAVLACRCLELGKRADPELAMDAQRLLRPQARHSKHFEDAGRHLLAQSFEAGMRTRAMERGDDLGNRLANA